VSNRDRAVKNKFKGLKMVIQKKPLGSGDAVRVAKSSLAKSNSNVLVTCGDTPLISKDTIKALIKEHLAKKPSCTILTTGVLNPTGYGRILRDDAGNVSKIIEEKDLSVYEEALSEINVGCYLFNRKALSSSIEKIKMNQKKKEYYLTDIIEILKKSGKKIISVSCDDPDEALGINSKLDLAKANEIIKNKVLDKVMLDGITIVDRNSTFIDIETKIGKDTIIYPNTIIEKNVMIGKSCSVGPFARLRPGTTLEDNVSVGNFVELVRTKIASGTRVKHMTYLGDTQVGKNVNVGAGTITANYDGKNKNKTIIGDNSFIGVGSILIAPVKVGKNATLGAGTVLTKKKNVPPGKTVIGIPARIINKKK